MKSIWNVLIGLSLVLNLVLVGLIIFYLNSDKFMTFDYLAFNISAKRICETGSFPVGSMNDFCNTLPGAAVIDETNRDRGVVYPADILNDSIEYKNKLNTVPTETDTLSTMPDRDPDRDRADAIPKGFIYVDRNGFSLTFPESWAGYTSAERELDWGKYGTSYSMDFGFPEQDSVFNISVHTKQQWDDIHAENGPAPTKLGENDLYIFGYSSAQYAANDKINARMQEVRSVVNTFQLVDLSAGLPN